MDFLVQNNEEISRVTISDWWNPRLLTWLRHLLLLFVSLPSCSIGSTHQSTHPKANANSLWPWGPFTWECFLCYSLTSFFFCTFLHSLSPTLKCCILLAKPGKLPLVSVNQEKNSGTHILMITELGKKHCFPQHRHLLLFCSQCFQLSSACFFVFRGFFFFSHQL